MKSAEIHSFHHVILYTSQVKHIIEYPIDYMINIQGS